MIPKTTENMYNKYAARLFVAIFVFVNSDSLFACLLMNFTE